MSEKKSSDRAIFIDWRVLLDQGKIMEVMEFLAKVHRIHPNTWAECYLEARRSDQYSEELFLASLKKIAAKREDSWRRLCERYKKMFCSLEDYLYPDAKPFLSRASDAGWDVIITASGPEKFLHRQMELAKVMGWVKMAAVADRESRKVCYIANLAHCFKSVMVADTAVWSLNCLRGRLPEIGTHQVRRTLVVFAAVVPETPFGAKAPEPYDHEQCDCLDQITF